MVIAMADIELRWMLSNHSLGFYLNQVKLIFAGFGLMKVHMQPTNHPYFTRNN